MYLRMVMPGHTTGNILSLPDMHQQLRVQLYKEHQSIHMLRCQVRRPSTFLVPRRWCIHILSVCTKICTFGVPRNQHIYTHRVQRRWHIHILRHWCGTGPRPCIMGRCGTGPRSLSIKIQIITKHSEMKKNC